MREYIILFGEASEADNQALVGASHALNRDIALVSAEEINPLMDTGNALGYVSFRPYAKESVIEAFGNRPLGKGRELPFFQRVCGYENADTFKDLPITGVFTSPLTAPCAWNMISAMIFDRMRAENCRELMAEIVLQRNQKQQLMTIGSALSSVNNIDKLLNLILTQSRALTCADAGSVYIREKTDPGGAFVDALRFKISQNDSIDVSKAAEYVIPMNKETIAGYVAAMGQPLTLDDVYELPAASSYRFGKDWDERLGYRVKSMLTVALKNLAGEVVGVLQLMNKKRDAADRLMSPDETENKVVAFTVSDEDFMMAVGAQAAASIERAQLYSEIENIFEGYLKSSTAAIDERDSITYGHSRRVMGYAMAFADAINAAQDGLYKDETFSDSRKNQFRFAALLHDIGKIGVPEALLMKPARLSVEAMAAMKARVDFIGLSLETARTPAKLPWNSTAELYSDFAFLENINKAGFLPDPDAARLAIIKEKWYFNGTGNKTQFFTQHEWESLSVRTGNLTPEERQRINSHVASTRRILSRIPWNKDLERIPDIACHHHERLDGSGYPDALKADQLCLESRILAVIDVYEALVSQERPYKPKMPQDKAIAILRSEAKANHLDFDVVEFFVNKGIYTIFPPDQPSDENTASPKRFVVAKDNL